MEQDSSYRHFLLDGQLAVIDDYLEIRPEHESRLAALTAAGRITVGPWYILMDEFLVSGETIVRNLQAGLRRAAAFGGAMDVGYLPDMFGHVAQMPQILAEAGFEHAVVWRGVPSAIDRNAFRWAAPDGSRGAGRVPGGRVRQRRRPPRRRQGAGTPAPGPPRGVRCVHPARGSPPAHERLRPPATPTVAGPGGGRGQPGPGRVRPGGHAPCPSTCGRRLPRGCPSGAASCGRGSAPTC